jgi:hypothetical protein
VGGVKMTRIRLVVGSAGLLRADRSSEPSMRFSQERSPQKFGDSPMHVHSIAAHGQLICLSYEELCGNVDHSLFYLYTVLSFSNIHTTREKFQKVETKRSFHHGGHCPLPWS